MTINAGSHKHVFIIFGVDNLTVQNLRLTGGTEASVLAQQSQNLVLRNLDISGWNTSGASFDFGEPHGISLSDYGTPMRNFLVEGCTIHNPGSSVQMAGIAVGGPSSGGTISNNNLSGTSDGIWFDVSAGAALLGYTPHLVKDNIVHDVTNIAFHIEARSSWIMVGNIAYNCCTNTAFGAITVRPGGGVGMAGHRYYNNTIYSTGPAFWVPNETGEIFKDAQFKNNIFISRGTTNATITVATPYHNDSSVIFQSNTIRNLGGGPGVCWGDASGSFSVSCNSPGVSYPATATGISNWQATAPSRLSSNLAGDPLFVNPTAGDFRLCEGAGFPGSSCTGRSPAIDAGVDVGLPYNGGAPDLGALESGGSGNTEILPPQNLQIVNP